MVELRLTLRQPGTQVFFLNHYSPAAAQLSPATKDKSSSGQRQSAHREAQGANTMALSSHGEIPRAKVGEAKGSLDCKGPGRTKDTGANECCSTGSLLPAQPDCGV